MQMTFPFMQVVQIRIPQALIKFFWHGKSPRIGIVLLLRSKLKGGLSFPDPDLYYIVAHMTRVIDGCRHTHQKLSLEQEAAIAFAFRSSLGRKTTRISSSYPPTD